MSDVAEELRRLSQLDFFERRELAGIDSALARRTNSSTLEICGTGPLVLINLACGLKSARSSL